MLGPLVYPYLPCNVNLKPKIPGNRNKSLFFFPGPEFSKRRCCKRLDFFEGAERVILLFNYLILIVAGVSKSVLVEV
jgi:hypothetical protein